MKKVFLGAATLALLSTSAYATKARLLALGDEVEDNYYTMDDRYIFTNASYVNNYGDMVVYEFGDEGFNYYEVNTAAGTATSPAQAAEHATLDSDEKSKAQGGFLKSHGNFTYGAFLGNESNVSSLLRIVASDGNTGADYLATADNQVDFFFGGKAGTLNWGTSLIYAGSERKNSQGEDLDDTALAVKLGVNKDNWDAFANISLASESENKGTGNKFEGKLGFQLGGSYTLNNNLKFYGSFKKFDWEQTHNAANAAVLSAGGKVDGGFTRYDIGVGRSYQATDSTQVFVRTQLTAIDIEVEYSAATSELSTMNLPLIIGFESKANDWLVLRGSVSQTVYGNADSKNLGLLLFGQTATPGATFETDSAGLKAAGIGAYAGNFSNDGEVSMENTTTVNLGATLTWNKIDVDTLVGSMSDNAYTRFAVKYNF
ncbi:hypothetical protein BALOs_2621 [Halobacteriovorax sp. BALOs_7]|uniref:hypothetical protein n=1 Tax=Halobacteriovorax sp. BALOs_7 TaxID=2109558 RepID=UPI000EA28C04|nr:hypothetical protein [Halobacteriovorax sp. BALOs_7]AYF45615.1 hypothetical protein BALOs_2621 [Halobacteriovorax sp. BALOs_7]